MSGQPDEHQAQRQRERQSNQKRSYTPLLILTTISIHLYLATNTAAVHYESRNELAPAS